MNPSSAVTSPPSSPFAAYRRCLRWEFGFTCAFCLLHERDFVEHGAARTGFMTIEHHVAQSEDAGQRDRYANCFLACRWCNGARHAAARVDAHGRRLLEPCAAAWGLHFAAVDGELRATSRDGDYTHFAYGLDDPRKVRLRRDRHEALHTVARILEEYPPLRDALLDRARQVPSEQRQPLLAAAQEMDLGLASARRTLTRFVAVPEDRDAACICKRPDALALPPFLASQTIQGTGQR